MSKEALAIRTIEDLVKFAKDLGTPTEGQFAKYLWEWSNHPLTPSVLAGEVMRQAGYKPFQGYPLEKK